MKSTENLRNSIDEIQKKIDKYELALFRVFNSDKGTDGQDTHIKYLIDSVEFYRNRQVRLTSLLDNIIAQDLFGDLGAPAPTPTPVSQESASSFTKAAVKAPDEEELEEDDEGEESLFEEDPEQ